MSAASSAPPCLLSPPAGRCCLRWVLPRAAGLQQMPAARRAAQVATVGQLTVLAPVAPPGGGAAAAAGGGGRADDGALCVVNTHLFFHPRAPHIRAMHTAALLAEAGALIDEIAAAPALAGRQPALLFCGDLNSDLNDGMPGAAP